MKKHKQLHIYSFMKITNVLFVNMYLMLVLTKHLLIPHFLPDVCFFCVFLNSSINCDFTTIVDNLTREEFLLFLFYVNVEVNKNKH